MDLVLHAASVRIINPQLFFLALPAVAYFGFVVRQVLVCCIDSRVKAFQTVFGQFSKMPSYIFLRQIVLIVVGNKRQFESNSNYAASIANMETVSFEQLKDAVR